MTPSTIQRLINNFHESFTRLHINVPTQSVERMAFLVHNAMAGERREFRTAHHALHVCGSLSAVETLAALFHDIIYVHVDNGFPAQLQDLLVKFVDVKNGEVSIRGDAEITNDQSFRLCLDVFDFQVGQTLPLSRDSMSF